MIKARYNIDKRNTHAVFKRDIVYLPDMEISVGHKEKPENINPPSSSKDRLKTHTFSYIIAINKYHLQIVNYSLLWKMQRSFTWTIVYCSQALDLPNPCCLKASVTVSVCH